MPKKESRLVSRDVYDALLQDEKDKKEKLPGNEIESYFTLLERHIMPKSCQLLTVEELRNVQQGFMSAQEFYSKVVKLVQDCKFPCKMAEKGH